MGAEADELEQAGDPTTSVTRLRTLATTTKRAEVREAIASNPNAPIDVWRSLLPEHAAACLRNPLLPLARLEDPGFLGRLSKDALTRLIESKPEDVELLGEIVTLALSVEGLTPENVYLHRHYQRRVAQALPEHPATPASLLELCVDLDDRQLVRVVAHPQVSEALLRRALASDDEPARRDARRHPRAPATFVALLERCGVADDMKTVTPTAHALTADEFCLLAAAGPFTWRLAARHPRLAPEAIESLEHHPSTAVIGALIVHDDAPASAVQRALGELALFHERREEQPPEAESVVEVPPDPSLPLRLGLAQRRGVSEDVLRRLGEDPVEAVYDAVAARPELSLALTLHLLTLRPHERTRRHLWDATTSVEVLAQIVEHHRQRVRLLSVDEQQALARHPHTPPWLLEWLARLPSESVRALAGQRLCPGSASPLPAAESATRTGRPGLVERITRWLGRR